MPYAYKKAEIKDMDTLVKICTTEAKEHWCKLSGRIKKNRQT